MLASDSVTLRIDTSNVHQEVVISMVNNGDHIVQDVMQQHEGCDSAVLIRKTEFSKATMMLTKSGAVQPKAFILPTPQVPASKLEPSLRFNNESLVVGKACHSSSDVDTLLLHLKEQLQVLDIEEAYVLSPKSA